MSQEELPASRKDKKAQRDAERKKPSKKRKHTETVDEDAAQEPQIEASFIPLAAVEQKPTETAPKKDASKPKKRKRDVEESQDGETVQPAVEKTTSKPKKRKTVKTDAAEGEAEKADGAADTKPTKSRFILFIGNLPFTTTDASLQEHFKKLMPFTLRHRTDPKTKKSKGFAFLEFENYDRMKTCLAQYHHSMFDPAELTGEQGKGYGKGGRKINVELTAGGGGKAAGRQDKIRVKNVRLEEQRTRRAELEKKQKAESEKKDGSAGKKKGEPTADVAAPVSVTSDVGGMHPSRLARM